jgi:hypothetical protein
MISKKRQAEMLSCEDETLNPLCATGQCPKVHFRIAPVSALSRLDRLRRAMEFPCRVRRKEVAPWNTEGINDQIVQTAAVFLNANSIKTGISLNRKVATRVHSGFRVALCVHREVKTGTKACNFV